MKKIALLAMLLMVNFLHGVPRSPIEFEEENQPSTDIPSLEKESGQETETGSTEEQEYGEGDEPFEESTQGPQQQMPQEPFSQTSSTNPSFQGNVSAEPVPTSITPERNIPTTVEKAPKIVEESQTTPVAKTTPTRPRSTTQLGKAVDGLLAAFTKGSIGINETVTRIKSAFTDAFKRNSKTFSSQIDGELQKMTTPLVTSLEKSNQQDLQKAQSNQKQNETALQNVTSKQDDLNAERQRLLAQYPQPKWESIGVRPGELLDPEMQKQIEDVDVFLAQLEDDAKKLHDAAIQIIENIEEKSVIKTAIKRWSNSNKGRSSSQGQELTITRAD
jgi:hypothetical protein